MRVTFLPESSTAGAPRGSLAQNLEDALESCRGRAKGESAEGREKPPWGVPLPRAGLGPAPTKTNDSLFVRRRGGSKTRPPGFQICSRKTVGATLAVARPWTERRVREAAPYGRAETSAAAGQFPILSVSLRSTSPLDKGSRPPPYKNIISHRTRAATWGRPYEYRRSTSERAGHGPAPTANAGTVAFFS